MNILLVSGPGISLKEPYNSGIEAFIVSFANQLVDEGHAVDVVADEAEAGAKFMLINPFTAFSSERPNFFTRLKEKRQFKNLGVDSYDVIHYNMFYPHLLEAGLHYNKTSFLTLHSPADSTRISAYKKLSQQSDVIFVAISERVKRQWEQALGIDMPLIYNGINMDLWPTNSSGDREYLLWSARINEEKNVAAAICVANHMQLPLKIAGRIVDQHYFDEKVKPHLNNQIQYVGHVTQRELSGLAKKASAYLATATWQEPFGLAALEMLASGVPIVGFNTAVPPNWEHESVLTTASLRWQDLVELVRKSNAISPGTCKEFASTMNIQNMTSSYVKLYREVLLQEGIGEEAISENDRVLSIGSYNREH
ncbi:glycosyltransferase [Dyadobacter arcticus]|uniref:Glycosyltransferase involved in cell wall biosynthesis n=1 Tax=Dyadobacter arcticus TaxID=1078754 RepID=A0ABX0UR43_9BACT|nr:glycosyltransferase [Dyadobacter arcticus]NIJ55441.1 glycosyltransferase involved in cell wall biosynthesis [Dyadobacter arcticus]